MRILFVLLVVLLSEVSATTYFVKPTGNNALDGESIGNAWLTIGKADSTVQPGDSVLISPGNYSGVSGPTFLECGNEEHTLTAVCQPITAGKADSVITYKGNGGYATFTGNDTDSSAAMRFTLSYYKFELIKFTHSIGVIIPGASEFEFTNVVVDSNTYDSCSNGGGIFSGYGTNENTNAVFDNCTFRDNMCNPTQRAENSMGISIYYGDSIEVRYCDFTETGEEDISGLMITKGLPQVTPSFSSDRIYIHDNRFSRLYKAIKLSPQDRHHNVEIDNNRFWRNAYHIAMVAQDSTDSISIHDNSLYGLSGITVAGNFLFGADIYNNLWIDMSAPRTSPVDNPLHGPISFNNNSYVSEDYNMFDDSRGASVVYYHYDDSVYTIVEWQGLSLPNVTGQGANSFWGDAKVTDPFTGDFTKDPTSEAIGAGRDGSNIGWDSVMVAPNAVSTAISGNVNISGGVPIE